MAEWAAQDFLTRRASDLAEKRPVTLTVSPHRLYVRLILVRPLLRELTRQLKLRGYVLTGRDGYSWTFTHRT